MSKTQRFTQVFIALALIASLLAPAAFAVEATPPRMSASLAELVAGDPDRTLRVIVQKADATGQAESLVQRWGGQVLKDLHIINAFAAELPARSVFKLASMAAVNWVALDSPMVPASTTLSAREEFNAIRFNGNDGIVSWAGDWIEDDVYGAGPEVGNVDIFNGGLRLDDRPDTGTYPSAARKIDLSSGVTSAIFSFDFQTGPGVDVYSDQIAIEVSSDGGVTYTVLEIMDDLGGANKG